MTKKDRVAVSISVVLFLITTIWSADIGKPGPFMLFFLLPVTCYWLYRFIKSDISFLQRNPKTTAKDSKADALLKWNELLEKGAITQEEYDKAKRDLLG